MKHAVSEASLQQHAAHGELEYSDPNLHHLQHVQACGCNLGYLQQP